MAAYVSTANHTSFSPPVLTSKTFPLKLADFERKCSNLAHQLLQGTDVPVNVTPIVHHHHYHSSLWWYPLWFPQPIVVVPSNRNSDNQGLLVILGLAAAAIAGVGLYITGSAVGRFQEANTKYHEAADFKEQLEDYGDRAPENEQRLVNEAKNLADLQERVTKRIRDSAVFDIACRASLVAGSMLVLFGSVMMLFGTATAAASSMALVGLSVVAAASGCMLFESGMNITEKRNLVDAQEIQEGLAQLKSIKR
jgi:hypothetical protein